MARSVKLPIMGTREWAANPVSCANGCSNNCRYCYARYNAVARFHRMNWEDWPNEEVREHDVKKRRHKLGRIMFPVTHDITPVTLDACVKVLAKLLDVGNTVLTTTKPRLDCVKTICDKFMTQKSQIIWRFTVGAYDNELLKYWEPKAPAFEERLASIKYAFKKGYRTSISCEPLLDPDNVVELFAKLAPYVTDTLWVGKLRKAEQRVLVKTQRDKQMLAKLLAGQTDAKVFEVYELLKDHPKICWKDSYKQTLGLPAALGAEE